MAEVVRGAPVLRRIGDLVALERLGPAWTELAERTGAPPWLEPGWFLPWWRAFGRGRLDVVVALDGERLRGIVPLSRRLGSLRGLANWHTPGFGVVAEDEEVARSLARAALATRPRSLDLAFVPERDPLRAVVREQARAAGHLYMERELERSPVIALGDRSWEAFEEGLDRKMLREIARRRRHLERRGPVDLEIVRGGAWLDRRLGEAFAIEASGWKGEQGTAIASEPRTERFYREVAAWAAGRGTLRLAFLRVAGRPIAFDLALECRGEHALLKTGFDRAFASSGPGQVLRLEMVRRAFAEGLRRYAFLGMDDAWKRAWTPETDRLLRLQVFAPTIPGRIERFAWRTVRPTIRRVLGR